MSEVSDTLRRFCTQLRRTPVSVAQCIPILQQAADEIDRLERSTNYHSNCPTCRCAEKKEEPRDE